VLSGSLLTQVYRLPWCLFSFILLVFFLCFVWCVLCGVFCVVCFVVLFLCFLGAECASSVVNSSRIRCLTFCVESHLLMILGLFWGPVWEHFCDCLRTLWTRSDMMLHLFAEASFFEDFGSLCGVLVGTYL